MSTPAMIYLALTFIAIGAQIHLHGKPYKGNHHFGGWLFGKALFVGLLYWGGFFSAGVQ